MVIVENVQDSKAAWALHATIGELLASEVSNLPSDRSRRKFWELMRDSVAKNLPQLEESKSEQEAPSMHWSRTQEVAFATMAEIEELAGSICAAGEDFTASVLEKSQDIIASVEQAGWATDSQLEALENMLEGLQAWFHD